MGYEDDSRVRALNATPWYQSFDEKAMTVEVEIVDDDGEPETHTLPARYVVCDLCCGCGKHINPSVDANGITSEEMERDPDFRSDYLSGVHDVTCYSCRGLRVDVAINEDELSEDQLAVVLQMQSDRGHAAECDAIERAEREAGA